MSATLILGDCIEKMKHFPDKSIDCFICDLPYGQLTGGGGQEKKKRREKNANDVIAGCEWDKKIDLEPFWKEVERLAKNDNTPVIHFCNTKFGIELIMSKPDWFRYDLVWNKERGVSFLLANKMPMKSHEMIYVFSKKGAYYNRVDIEGEFKSWKAHDTKSHTRTVIEGSGRNVANANDGTKRSALSVINIRKPNTLGHPTEKPEELYEWLLRRYCPVGGIMMDPTAGSFNSVLVAKRLGMHGVGIESDRNFFYAAVKKFEKNLTAEKA
jgi:site-specific DNA-methyltransferase (adenine-specific)